MRKELDWLRLADTFAKDRLKKFRQRQLLHLDCTVPFLATDNDDLSDVPYNLSSD